MKLRNAVREVSTVRAPGPGRTLELDKACLIRQIWFGLLHLQQKLS